MNGKSGKVEKTPRRRILAACLTATILLVITPALRALTGLDSISLARAQDDSAPALAAGSDTLAEWHVFLVATNNYYDPNDPNLPALRYAEADADSLEKIFKAFGVKDENITVLKSSNQSYFTRSNKESIEEGYQRFLDGLTEKSIAFVFLCGHGFGEKTRSYYLPEDCTIKNRDEKKISIDDMMVDLAASKARFKWMCVDACRNEIGKRGFGERSLSINDAPEGILLTQSCSEGQFSYEVGKSDGAPSDNGVFTRVFVNAISGRDPSADADQDGRVTLRELRDYVCRQAPLDARKYFRGAVQNPVFTSLDGASFEEFAQYPLFEDRDWREALRLREDAEKLVQQEDYAEALKKIQDASRLRPKDMGIASLKDEIEKLFNERDINQKAETAYKRAQEALNAKKYDEARNLIREALRLKPGEAAYDVFGKLIDAQEKLDTQEPPKSRPTASGSTTTTANATTKSQTAPTNDEPSSSSRKAGASRTITINGVDVVFHWCPPTGPDGFKMGSPTSEDARRDDETQHTVMITKGFWIAESETTQEFWRAVMGNNNNPSNFRGDKLPVEMVNWNDCQMFIGKLNATFEDKGICFKLPSEAHWEYACRAGSTTPFFFGSVLNGDKANCNGDFPYGTNSKGKSLGKTAPVGSYEPNMWGLKDMHGNVLEWCHDWYGDYPARTATDPEGPDNGLNRVIRGGGWDDYARRCRAADRHDFSPIGKDDSIGFRLEMDDIVEGQNLSPLSRPEGEQNLPVFSITHDPVSTNPKAGESRSITIDGVETVFRWCPPGEFMMGSPEDTPLRNDDERQHRVVLTKGFWLCEIPVTVEAFQKFVDDTGYRTEAEKDSAEYTWRKPGWGDYSFTQNPDHPVVFVSWDDAQAYVDWANKKYAPRGMKLRLPSEAHWEYACRAGSKTEYWWGDKAEDGEGNANVADASAKRKFPDWCCFSFDDGFRYTSPVGRFQANAWNLKDMIGNVWEWCSDWYWDYPEGTATDPKGANEGSFRVVRGGGWNSNALYCRSVYRFKYPPDSRLDYLGFRLELSDISK